MKAEPFDPEKERMALFGLTEESSDEERRQVTFEAAAKARTLSVTTISPDQRTAHARILSFYLLSDGNLYTGTAMGKAVYADLQTNPRVTLTTAFYEEERLRAYGIHITGMLVRASDPAMIEEYWRINPGTRQMYIKGLELFEVLKLESGNGEIQHVYTAGHIARLRFGFGGEPAEPARYSIGPNCTQCGICEEACLTGTIHRGVNGCYIRTVDCLGCGKCREVCPVPGGIQIYSDGVYH